MGQKNIRPRRKVLRLRQLRRAREMSQAALGQRVGLDKAMICQIEKGTRQPSLGKAKLLAAEFGLPIEEILSYVEVAS
jgi:DNA-binding XRE family transcriptional regulator